MIIRKKIVYAAVAAALGAWSASSLAGGFGIGTQSGSGTGNAFAGGAAVADDASVLWSNPAGMTALPTGIQVTTALHVLRPSFKFQNDGSTGAFALPGTGEGGDGGDWAFVPNGFMAMSITPALRVGVALNVPFGLTTNYNAGWRGQLLALKSAIKTINVQPSIAYQVSPAFSIGAGVSVQKIDARLTNFAGAAGVATLTADDIGWGFNIGAAFQPTNATRIGLHYRSAIKYDLKGNVNFSNPAANSANGVTAAASLKVPDSASLSILQQVGSNHRADGRRDLDGVGQSAAFDGRAHVVQRGAVRRRQSPGRRRGFDVHDLGFRVGQHLAFGPGRQLSLEPANQAALWRGVRSDADQRSAPHAASARSRPHLGGVRRAIQTEQTGHAGNRLRARIRQERLG